MVTPQEQELKDAGIPVPDGFGGNKKSFTLSPSDPEKQSQIGVLPDPQGSCYEVKYRYIQTSHICVLRYEVVQQDVLRLECQEHCARYQVQQEWWLHSFGLEKGWVWTILGTS